MGDSGLAKKLKLRPGSRAALIHAPKGYAKELAPPKEVSLSEKLGGKFDWIQFFAETKADVDRFLPKLVAALNDESILWLSFPKGTSKIQTDLTRDKGWDALQRVDLKWVTLVSVNDTWSAFALRPYKAGEKRQEWR